MQKKYNIQTVAKQIRFAIKEWPGRCHFISKLCIEHEVVKGIARYGHYLGPVAKGSFFDRGTPFQRHGWVELPDGTIFDPTRWVFENVKPYIYVGTNQGEYDIGGSTFRDLLRTPPPIFDNTATCKLNLSRINRNWMKQLLEDKRKSSIFSQRQIAWLANCNPNLFFDAKEFYKELQRTGNKAFIPIDYWDFVMGDK